MQQTVITCATSGEMYDVTARQGDLTIRHCEEGPTLTIDVDDPTELVELLVTVAAAVEQATRRTLAQPAVTRGLLIPENMGTRIADARQRLEQAAGHVART